MPSQCVRQRRTSFGAPVLVNEMNEETEDTAGARKARGAFFTPPPIAEFISNWAVRSLSDRVLEPSCGDAIFLQKAGLALRSRGLAGPTDSHLHGLDLHKPSVEQARRRLAGCGLSASFSVGDFFERSGPGGFDAVIGNPPYVRYQAFSGADRLRALEAALRQGVRINQLASSWAAFTVHAASFLRPGGRLGLVLPAELLSVGYAAQIRRFLLSKFKSVRLVLFEELVFPGVLEEVVVLLAEGDGASESFEVFQARNANSLSDPGAFSWMNFSPEADAKWTSALIPEKAIETYQSAILNGKFGRLRDWGSTYLGAVSGNNGYFALNSEQVLESKLTDSDLVRISPPGAKHLRGLTLNTNGWRALAEGGARCYLFSPKAEPSAAGRRYIALGVKAGVDRAYKCTARTPWWRVPLVKKPDLLLTYMNHGSPRLVRNEARVELLNSVYGVSFKPKLRSLGNSVLPIAALNSLTALGAELVGRSYGGGLLKHEPREADMLPMPGEQLLATCENRLRLLRSQVEGLMRSSDISSAVDIVDGVVLRDGFGLSEDEVKIIRDARASLMNRRLNRAKHGAN